MSAQAPSVHAPTRVPLITQFGNRDESLTRDAKLLNCFAEKDVATGDYQIKKRIGLSTFLQSSGAGQGVYNWDGVFYSINNGGVLKNGSLLGYVDAAHGKYVFVQLLGVPKRLVFTNGVHMYYTDGTTISEVEQYQVEHAGYLTTDVSTNTDPSVIGDWLLTTPGRGNHYEIITVGTTDFAKCGFLCSATGGSLVFSNGHFVVGHAYIINSNPLVPSNGTEPTNFTAIGAESNAIGTPFIATAIGYSVGGVLQGQGTVVNAATNVVGSRFYATQVGEGTGTVALTAWGMEVGKTYTIRTVGDTDFTLHGAATNTVGTVFTCTSELTTYSASCGTLESPNFPSTTMTKGFVYLDGTLYVMDENANIYGSKRLDDPVVWDPLNKIVARVEPDPGVALAKQLTYVVALKRWTTEVFYDAGNSPPGSPLAPVQGAKSPYGCVSADSVQEIDDVLFWLSSNKTVSPQVVRMENLRVQVVSTPAVDRLLERAVNATILSWVFKHGGHKFYGVTVKESNITLVYDIDQNLWYLWTDKDGNYWPIMDMSFNQEYYHVAQHESNGKIYIFEGDYEFPTDAGDIVPVDIYTPRTDFGIDRRKFVNQLRINADKAVGMLQIRVSDDDYETWSAFREVDLSHRRPILSNCGTFYRRAWHFHYAAATAFRLTSADLQMDIGTL